MLLPSHAPRSCWAPAQERADVLRRATSVSQRGHPAKKPPAPAAGRRNGGKEGPAPPGAQRCAHETCDGGTVSWGESGLGRARCRPCMVSACGEAGRSAPRGSELGGGRAWDRRLFLRRLPAPAVCSFLFLPARRRAACALAPYHRECHRAARAGSEQSRCRWWARAPARSRQHMLPALRRIGSCRRGSGCCREQSQPPSLQSSSSGVLGAAAAAAAGLLLCRYPLPWLLC